MHDWQIVDRKVGNWYQVAGTRHYMLTNGNNNGTRAIDVRTGGGLEYTLLPDRGLDISLASYKGVNLVYQGTGGEVNPANYNCRNSEWLRQFFAGLLTTCGPDNIGPPCVDEGEEFGLHGRFNNTPARNICDQTNLEAEDATICVSGEIDCSVLFGSRLRTRRQVISPVDTNRIIIIDKIRNCGGHTVPLTILYHINLGYPLLDENTSINVHSSSLEAYDEYSRQYIGDVSSFLPPDAINKEKNYLHRFADQQQGLATVANSKLGIKLNIGFSLESLNYMTQWKMEGVKDYVLGLEPANCPCLARDQLRSNRLLPYIEPGEEIDFQLELSVES